MRKLTSRQIIPFIKTNLPLEFYEKCLKDISEDKFEINKFVLDIWDLCDTDDKRTEFMKMLTQDEFFGAKVFAERIKNTSYEGQYVAIMFGDNK